MVEWRFWKKIRGYERAASVGKEVLRKEALRYIPEEAKILDAIEEGRGEVKKIVEKVEASVEKDKGDELGEIKGRIFKFGEKSIQEQLEEVKKQVESILEKKASDLTIRDQMLLKQYDFLLNLLKEREREFKEYEMRIEEKYKIERLRRLQEGVRKLAADLCKKHNIVSEAGFRTVEAILLAHANEIARKEGLKGEFEKWGKRKRFVAAIGHTIETLPGAGEGISGFILGTLATILNPVVVGVILLYLLFAVAGGFIAGVWSGTMWITMIILAVLLTLVELSRYWKAKAREEMEKGE